MLWYESTADEIESGNNGIAVLPIGSTEQHGPHLPIATDFIIAGSVAKGVAEKLGAYLLPALPISTCREHMGKKGSVWMNPDTFYNMVGDIVMSLKEQGFKKVVIILGHGGIFIANPAVRELNATNPDIKVIKVDLCQLNQSAEIASIIECKDNLHACEMETSLMLYLREDLVRKEKIVDCIPGVPRDYLNYGSIFRYSKCGVWGKPSLASKEKGERILKVYVEKSIEYINDVSNIIGYRP
ncbi:MAG: creatininase family protein [Clostridiaceae bacterium]